MIVVAFLHSVVIYDIRHVMQLAELGESESGDKSSAGQDTRVAFF